MAGTFELGLPRLAASTVPLFALATRFSALALLGMTLVIQLFAYPGAYPTHGVWAACLLLLVARGPGAGQALWIHSTPRDMTTRWNWMKNRR